MKKLLFAILIGFVGAVLFGEARAQTYTLGVDAVSAHVPRRDDNNFNPGLSLRSSDHWIVGAYRNSLNRTTVYAGLTLESGPWLGMISAATGYKRTTTQNYCLSTISQTDLTPSGQGSFPCGSTEKGYGGAIVPLVAISYGFPAVLGITPRVTLIPPAPHSNTAVHLSFERAL